VKAASDDELMARLRAGDLAKLGTLFDRHHLRLFRFFLKLSGQRQAAEDLVQDVFVRMLRYSHSYREQGEFLPWMFKVARNAAADYFEKRGREVAMPEGFDPPSAACGAHEEMEQADLARWLRVALLQLPADKRELLLLSRELRYDEIGEMIGVSVGAVKVRVHRALQELRVVYRDLISGGAA
jgi:RNA polymerase sigma-70 factor (ECF subfamily)